MIAIMKNNEYRDLIPGKEYEIDRIYSKFDGHIKLKGSPRRYESSAFIFYDKGKKISQREAYRRFQLETVKRKLGV